MKYVNRGLIVSNSLYIQKGTFRHSENLQKPKHMARVARGKGPSALFKIEKRCSTKVLVSHSLVLIFSICTYLLKTLLIVKPVLKTDNPDQQPRHGRGC